MATRSAEIDAIHSALPPAVRRALESIRRAVHAAAPGAEECLSYGMPAVSYEGKPLVAWRAAAKHCAFHPLSGSTVAALAAHLTDYDTSPGTIRFAADRVLPPSLVKRLVAARIAENRALGATGSPRPRKATPAGKAVKPPARKIAKKAAARAKGKPSAAPRSGGRRPAKRSGG